MKPENIPAQFAAEESLTKAYSRGYNNGHGIACHNVPTLGEKVFSDSLGRVTVDADNVREIHQDACFSAESASRDYSPFEFTAHEFNEAENSEELWEAYEAGIADSIADDLAGYSDEDYGIPAEEPEADEQRADSQADAVARELSEDRHDV